MTMAAANPGDSRPKFANPTNGATIDDGGLLAAVKLSVKEEARPRDAARPNWGQRDKCGKDDCQEIGPEAEEMLRALASVVVDELIELKNAEMSPAQIETMFTDESAGEETCE